MKKKKFLDRCDMCHNPRVCRGYDGMLLCEECIEKKKKIIVVDCNNEIKKIKKGQISIYDLM